MARRDTVVCLWAYPVPSICVTEHPWLVLNGVIVIVEDQVDGRLASVTLGFIEPGPFCRSSLRHQDYIR